MRLYSLYLLAISVADPAANPEDNADLGNTADSAQEQHAAKERDMLKLHDKLKLDKLSDEKLRELVSLGDLPE
jgi:hypothetical protein